jgi:predicted nucleic acid-binding protein
MKKVVADASFCGAWIFDEASEAAELLLRDLINGTTQLVVPALWHYEMGNMLRSGHRRGRLSKSAMRAAVKALGQVPVNRVDVPQLQGVSRLVELAVEFELSAYDAAYLELSTRLKVPLLTTDKVLKKAYDKLLA